MPIDFEIQQGLPCVFTNLPNLVFIKFQVSHVTSNRDDNKKEKEVQLKIYSNVVKIPELVDLVRQWEKAYEEQSRNELKFSGSLTTLAHCSEFNFSTKLLSILHHLENVAITNPSTKTLTEFFVEEDYLDEGEERKAEHLLPQSIEVEKNVSCEVFFFFCICNPIIGSI